MIMHNQKLKLVNDHALLRANGHDEYLMVTSTSNHDGCPSHSATYSVSLSGSGTEQEGVVEYGLDDGVWLDAVWRLWSFTPHGLYGVTTDLHMCVIMVQ